GPYEVGDEAHGLAREDRRAALADRALDADAFGKIEVRHRLLPSVVSSWPGARTVASMLYRITAVKGLSPLSGKRPGSWPAMSRGKRRNRALTRRVSRRPVKLLMPPRETLEW